MDQRCTLTDILKLLFDILEDLGWVVFTIEYPGHDLHVAVRNIALIPQLLQIVKGFVNGLFVLLLVPPGVRLVADLVFIHLYILFSREVSYTLLTYFISFLHSKGSTSYAAGVVYF